MIPFTGITIVNDLADWVFAILYPLRYLGIEIYFLSLNENEAQVKIVDSKRKEHILSIPVTKKAFPIDITPILEIRDRSKYLEVIAEHLELFGLEADKHLTEGNVLWVYEKATVHRITLNLYA